MAVSSLRLYLAAAAAVSLVGPSCSSSSSGSTAPPAPLITMTSSTNGDGQAGIVATALPNPLRVVVTLSGAPQMGTTVSWSTQGTGASVNPPTSVTDANGIATTTWTLGQAAGNQSATASLAGATGSPVTFAATGTPGAAAQIAAVTGSGQSTATGAAYANPLVVKISDQFGNGVASDTVAWASLHALTNVANAKTASGVTGLAQVSFTAGGAPGADTVTATGAGLTGSPVRFSATVLAVPVVASVTVGPGITFTSVKNGTSNPAADTVAVNGTVTWTWAVGSVSHGIQSTGSPSFTSQAAAQTSGTYSFTFTSAGTYTYNCLVHGSGMTGTIVVR